jgi:hypothetical protein
MNRDYNTLEEKFLNAPDDIQIALGSQDVFKKLNEIAKKYSFDKNATDGLIEETALVMLGVTNPSDFIRDLSLHLGTTTEKSTALAKDINEEIFQPVKESLKIVHGIKDEVTPTTPVTPSAPKPLTAPVPPVAPIAPKPPAGSSVFPGMIVPPKINIEIAPKPPVASQPPQPQNIFEQKLQGVFKMPKEETLVPQKPSPSPTPPTPPRPSGVDPYREPAK